MTSPATSLFRAENGYDLVRLLLAALVIFAHSFPLGGFGPNPVNGFFQNQMLLGHICVLGFFGLSGFLVSASCDRSPGLVIFLRKRFLRIFPGFWCCLLVCAFVFAPIIAAIRGLSFPVAGEHGALGYITQNFFLVIRRQSVGSLLVGLPHPADLNASLWSLWPEFFCYACLAALGLAGGLARNRALTLLGAFLLLIFHLFHISNPALHTPLLPVLVDEPFIYLPFFLSFSVGTTLYAWRDAFAPNLATAAALAATTFFFLRTGGFLLTGPILIPLVVIFTGACFRVHLKHDFSYGLYIYAFPVQQLLTAAWPRLPWFVYLVLSLVFSFFFAAASWFLVERRFLRSRSSPHALPA